VMVSIPPITYEGYSFVQYITVK